MLKEKFLPGKAFIFFIISLVSAALFLAVMNSIADHIIGYLKYQPGLGYPNKPLMALWYNFLLTLIGIFIYFIFLLLFIIEFIYRNYKLSFGVFLLMSIIVSLFCAWLVLNNHISDIPALEYKYVICFIFTGIAYPFISNFWARKIKFIILVPSDD